MQIPQIPENATRVFKGIIYEVYQWEQELFDGTTTTFERFKRPNTVQIIPVLPEGQILLLREEQPTHGSYISIPGGRVDHEGEDELTAAKRELLEETGYEATTWIPWLSFAPDSNVVWLIHYFIAKGLTKVAEPVLDPGEKITLYPVSYEEFLSIPESDEYIGSIGGTSFTNEIMRAKYNQAKADSLYKLLYA